MSGHDVFVGGGGFDEMLGEGGDDIFVGSDGEDHFDGDFGLRLGHLQERSARRHRRHDGQRHHRAAAYTIECGYSRSLCLRRRPVRLGIVRPPARRRRRCRRNRGWRCAGQRADRGRDRPASTGLQALLGDGVTTFGCRQHHPGRQRQRHHRGPRRRRHHRRRPLAERAHQRARSGDPASNGRPPTAWSARSSARAT